MSNEDQLEWLDKVCCGETNMIEYIKGDLFETDCKFIAHGVNCQAVMGSGVAKIVRQRFPKSYDRYQIFSRSAWYPNHDTLEWDKASLLGDVCICDEENGKHIIHCFTQLNYGKNGARYVNYDALVKCFTKLANQSFDMIAMPKIGAGLGGGDWNIIEAIIKNTLCKTGIKVKVYSID